MVGKTARTVYQGAGLRNPSVLLYPLLEKQFGKGTELYELVQPLDRVKDSTTTSQTEQEFLILEVTRNYVGR